MAVQNMHCLAHRDKGSRKYIGRVDFFSKFDPPLNPTASDALITISVTVLRLHFVLWKEMTN